MNWMRCAVLFFNASDFIFLNSIRDDYGFVLIVQTSGIKTPYKKEAYPFLEK